jgi:hypothetical protein
LNGENVVLKLEEHLFRWDEAKWEEVTEKDKKRIIEFIIHNYDPKLSLTAKIEKTDEKTIKKIYEKSTVFLILEAGKGKMNVEIAEKTEELILKKDIDKKGIKELTVYLANPAQGPGDRFVGPAGIVLTKFYLILLSGTIVYNLVYSWLPQELGEKDLFLLVASAGAPGSLVHALRSFYRIIGNCELVCSWLAMYILPVTGAMLALIFYIAIRGGLFPQTEAPKTSTFGFVAISALVGLFSVQAALKLQDIAGTAFTKAGQGRRSKPQVEDKHEKNWKGIQPGGGY